MNQSYCLVCGKEKHHCVCEEFRFDEATIKEKVARANQWVNEMENEDAWERKEFQTYIEERLATAGITPVPGIAKRLRRPRALQRKGNE